MAAELIQIIYDESQREACYPFTKVYFNEKLTIFFENSPIVEMVSATKADTIAVCSWKLRQKMKYYIGQPREITEEVLNTDYDVLSFTKNTKHHTMLAAADKWHKGFKSTMSEILCELEIPMPREVKIPIYQNHFSAKTEIYQDYVKTYLSPAMDLMLNDENINRRVMEDSNYSKLDNSSAETLKALEEKLGVSYYPIAPFILERLFSIYVHNKRINVTHL